MTTATAGERVTVDRHGLVWAVTAAPDHVVAGCDVFVGGVKQLGVVSAKVIAGADPLGNPLGRVVCRVRDGSGDFAKRNGRPVTIDVTGKVEILRRR